MGTKWSDTGTALHSFGENGWRAVFNDEWDCGLCLYTATFLTITYSCDVTAFVSQWDNHVSDHGDLGVCWLESKHETDNPRLTYSDVKDMERSFEIAEDNLLRCGIPFIKDYKFHGQAEEVKKKKEQNLVNRTTWNLDPLLQMMRNGEEE